ncbi:helix-turn-helix transcriptional regulator [Catenuloplanes atrovinosus]|uniref:AraC-like DNA-binding protein n=1 Tax=Catenuloplanes atrovinosus TaxID=137266 RepID=A0AAE4CAL4_9ACTN|nr:helix-turn-helix transcriptional regulator [Catenuloplanes atrovinosus]MDR7275939.1 AraC-like DNA-binding protein [Catenuloplanes atrovinosus]
MPTIFDSDDPDAAYHAITAMYRTSRISAIGRRHRVRIAQDVIGDAAELHRIVFPMRFNATAPPLRTLVVGRVRSGAITYRDSGRADHYGAGDVYLLGAPAQEYDTAVHTVDAEFARIGTGLINQLAEAAPDRAGSPVRFTGYRPVTHTGALLWTQTYDFARHNAATAATEPLLADAVSRLLAATALTVFPSTALHDPTIEDRHDAHPAAVRRAIAYIESDAHREIGLADIATAAHVTIRAVQLGFRRHLGTTPTAYLRRVRLAHAHHDLTVSTPGTTTVAAIAARWGFASPGRFTAHYRAAYGRTPSQTLHRG